MAMNLYNNNISDYFKMISDIPLLEKDEEKRLMDLASKGNKNAQNKLVEANLRFVIKIANMYKGKGMDLEDLVSEGNTGLIIAATKIDPERNVRFITYARWWIHQSIQKALYDSGKVVRIPLNRKDEFNTDKWDSISIYEKTSSVDSETVLCDLISDDKSNNPEDSLVEKCDEILFKLGFDYLTDEEKLIINYRYGLNGCDCLMLAEIGKMLGTSRETVRQKEIKILNKMKNFIMSPETVVYAA